MPGLALIPPEGADFTGGMPPCCGVQQRHSWAAGPLYLSAIRDKMGDSGMPRGRDSTKMPCFWHEEAVFSGAFQFEFLLVFHEHGAGLFPQCFHMAGKKLLASMVRIWASCESASWFSSFPVDVESPAVFFDPSGEDGTGELGSGQITCSGVVQETSKAFSTISYSRSVSRILMLMKIVPGRVLFAVFYGRVH